MLLHGFMGDCRDFSAIVDRLRGFCCLVVDLPDHGQTQVVDLSDRGQTQVVDLSDRGQTQVVDLSDRGQTQVVDLSDRGQTQVAPNHYQMDDVARGLIELLNELAIEQCWLAGYSMGGRIALYLASYFPQYFRGVILESASPGLRTQQERDRRIIRDLQLARQLESGLPQFLRQWYANPLFESFTRQPNFSEAIARRLDNNPYKLARSLRSIGLGMQPSLWDLLPQVQPPLLLIVGALDLKFVAIAREIVTICPRASLNIVKNTGHNVHFEQSAQFVKAIENFIDRLN